MGNAMRFILRILSVALLALSARAATVIYDGDAAPPAYSAGDTLILSNTIGSPIVVSADNVTIRAAAGARMSAAYWPASGAINLPVGRSGVTIDGVIIAATNNGTLLANHQDSSGIYGTSLGSDITIRNCIITNLFLRVPLANGNVTNSQPVLRGVYLAFNGANNMRVESNTLVHVGNAIAFNLGGVCTNLVVRSNYISDVSFGVNLNVNAAGWSSNTVVSMNYCRNLSTYDGNWGAASEDHNHNNFLIINSTAWHTNYGMRIERNFAGPEAGVYVTSFIKLTPDYPTFHSAIICNNVLVNDDPDAVISNGYISADYSPNLLVANNTLINVAGTSPATRGFDNPNGNYPHHVAFLNNVIYSNSTVLSDRLSVPAGGGVTNSDFNALWNTTAMSDSAFYGHGATFQTLADWKANNPGFEVNSVTGKPAFAADWSPLTNDTVLIGAGTNLSAHFTTDFNGVTRTNSGAWTIGAFEVGSTNLAPVGQTATPTFSPASGTVFTNSVSVVIASTTPDAEIHYSTSGTATTNSTLYTGALTLSSTTTVCSLIAARICVPASVTIKDSFSDVIGNAFIINPPKLQQTARSISVYPCLARERLPTPRTSRAAFLSLTDLSPTPKPQTLRKRGCT